VTRRPTRSDVESDINDLRDSAARTPAQKAVAEALDAALAADCKDAGMPEHDGDGPRVVMRFQLPEDRRHVVRRAGAHAEADPVPETYALVARTPSHEHYLPPECIPDGVAGELPVSFAEDPVLVADFANTDT